MSNQTSAEFVTVDIYDQTYHLAGRDLERTRQLAARVDERMRAVAAAGRTADSLRVAVLAALNFADEAARLEDELARLSPAPDSAPDSAPPQQTGALASTSGSPQPDSPQIAQLRQRAATLNRLLEAVLVEAPTPD